ncbi:MAG TPA: hypothetical protein VGC54_05175 [Planctomycetota bacterium]
MKSARLFLIAVPAALFAGWASAPGPAVAVELLGVVGGAADPARGPALLGSANGARLLVNGPDATREHAVDLQGGALGSAAAAAVDWPASATSGVLAIEDLDELPRPWSAALPREGFVTRAGVRIGWSPAVARDADGRAWLAYDAYRDGDYDVVLRAPDGSESVLAGSARAEFHPSLAFDARGRLWATWDECGENWGRGGTLHRERTIRMVVRVDGAWHEIEPPAQVRDAKPGSGPLKPVEALPVPDPPGPEEFAERPRVLADANGAVWLLWRGMRRMQPIGGRNCLRVEWRQFAAAWTAEGWTEAVELPGSDGANADALAAIALPGGGILAAWESDERRIGFQHVELWKDDFTSAGKVALARLQVAGSAPELAAAPAWTIGRTTATTPATPRDPDPTMVPQGFVRLWGDLHRHTDLSRCNADEDGTLADQYRYAEDIAGLDFLAVTDHYQHFAPDAWRYQIGVADRHDRAGGFSALFGFERVFGIGHRNMITASRADARTAPWNRPTPEELWDGFDPAAWLSIPHQITDRSQVHWEVYEPELERVIELFQGMRGSYEAPRNGLRRDLEALPFNPFAVQYLNQGRRFGFLASSDHGNTLQAFAVVLARENSRAAVYEALHERRVYAATARIALDVQLGALQMGEEGPVDAAAPLQIRVAAGAEIANVEVVRGSKVAKAWHGPTETADGRNDRLLRVRFGRGDGRRALRFGLDNATGSDWSPYQLEADDELTLDDGEVVYDGSVVGFDEDGFARRVQWQGDAALTIASRTKKGMHDFAKLEPFPKEVKFAGTAMELRLDPPPLGGERFESVFAPGDWRPGEWVYVRVQRTDGECAWSSPIWIDAPAEPQEAD